MDNIQKFNTNKFYILRASAPWFAYSYYISDEDAQRLFYVREKYFIQTWISIFDDDKAMEPILTINSRGFWRTKFFIRDSNNNLIGKIVRRQRFLFIKDYAIINNLDAIIGKVKPPILSLMRNGYIFLNERCIGTVGKRSLFSAEYMLNLTRDPDRHFNRQLALSMAVALCSSGYF